MNYGTTSRRRTIRSRAHKARMKCDVFSNSHPSCVFKFELSTQTSCSHRKDAPLMLDTRKGRKIPMRFLRNDSRPGFTWMRLFCIVTSLCVFLTGAPRAAGFCDSFLNHRPRSLTFTSTSSQADSELAETDGTLGSRTFQERYGSLLPSWLTSKCSEVGYHYPTRIQERALDAILVDRSDVIVQAETGSGKTLCYLLPCLAAVDPTRASVQAFIVVPTRELGLQVARIAKRLAAASANEETSLGNNPPSRIMVMAVLQGSFNSRQRAWAWAEPPHVVIGTPRELLEMVRLRGIKRYNSVRFLVVDEVDACLLSNAGGLTPNLASSALHTLLSKYLSPTYDDGSSLDGEAVWLGDARKARPLFRSRQTVFCSASIPQPRHFVQQCVQNQWTLKEPVHVRLRVGEQLLPASLEHVYVVCAANSKRESALQRIIEKIMSRASTSFIPKKVLIFADPHRPLDALAEAMTTELENSTLWKESYGEHEECSSCAIVAVLKYEDSLSQRASAIQVFRGERHLATATTTKPGTADVCTGGGPPWLRILWSTDLAARGLDIANVTHVVHYDLPPDVDTYVHRAGRTGRLNRPGQVVSVITPEQEFVLQRLINQLHIDIRCIGRQKMMKSSSSRQPQTRQNDSDKGGDGDGL